MRTSLFAGGTYQMIFSLTSVLIGCHEGKPFGFDTANDEVSTGNGRYGLIDLGESRSTAEVGLLTRANGPLISMFFPELKQS